MLQLFYYYFHFRYCTTNAPYYRNIIFEDYYLLKSLLNFNYFWIQVKILKYELLAVNLNTIPEARSACQKGKGHQGRLTEAPEKAPCGVRLAPSAGRRRLNTKVPRIVKQDNSETIRTQLAQNSIRNSPKLWPYWRRLAPPGSGAPDGACLLASPSFGLRRLRAAPEVGAGACLF